MGIKKVFVLLMMGLLLVSCKREQSEEKNSEEIKQDTVSRKEPVLIVPDDLPKDAVLDFEDCFIKAGWEPDSENKNWTKTQGEKTYYYNEEIIEGEPFTAWLVTQNSETRHLSSSHKIIKTQNLEFPEIHEIFRVELAEFKNNELLYDIIWEWDNNGMSQRYTKRKNENYSGMKIYYYNEGKTNYTENGKAGDYSFFHEGFSNSRDNYAVYEKGKGILFTEYNTEDKSAAVTIYDPETGKKYCIDISEDSITYDIEKNEKLQKAYSISYDKITNKSLHFKSEKYIDEMEGILQWEQIFPEEKKEEE